MGSFNKFQCFQCKGIVVSDITDNVVRCGHCDALCTIPDKLGPGVVIDDFLIEKLLGKGGMGNVFLAHQHSLDRKVALKIMHPRFQQDPKFNVEFVKEARSVASLNHPNIIQAYKVGEENGMLFFAMEMVEGRDLLSMIREDGPLKEKDVYAIAIDVATALGYAWDKSRLVHRDIKPENIMLTQEGDAKVMDLGLSKRDGDVDEDSEMVSGTPQYISPEQVTGEEVDNRTDFYSLGASLFHMLTGRFVFEARDIQEMVKMHLSAKPPSLHKVNPDISEELSRIVRKLLAKNKERRYKNSEELIVDLKKSRKSLTKDTSSKKHFSLTADSPVTKSKKHRRPAKKKKKSSNPVLVLVAVVLVVAVIVALSSGNGTKPSQSSKGEMVKNESKKNSSNTVEKPALQTLAAKRTVQAALLKTAKAIPKVNIAYLYKTPQEDLNNNPVYIKLRKFASKITAVNVRNKNFEMPEDQQLVVISDSVESGHIGKRFRDANIPVIIWEASLYDDMGMTGKEAGKYYSQGTSTIDSDSIMIKSVHPIAAKISGSVKIYSSSKNKINWGVPASSANIVAVTPGKQGYAAVFCYERGAKMIDGTAKARRVGMCLSKTSLNKITEDGLKIFDAAINWALQDKPLKK